MTRSRWSTSNPRGLYIGYDIVVGFKGDLGEQDPRDLIESLKWSARGNEDLVLIVSGLKLLGAKIIDAGMTSR